MTAELNGGDGEAQDVPPTTDPDSPDTPIERDSVAVAVTDTDGEPD